MIYHDMNVAPSDFGHPNRDVVWKTQIFVTISIKYNGTVTLSESRFGRAMAIKQQAKATRFIEQTISTNRQSKSRF